MLTKNGKISMVVRSDEEQILFHTLTHDCKSESFAALKFVTSKTSHPPKLGKYSSRKD